MGPRKYLALALPTSRTPSPPDSLHSSSSSSSTYVTATATATNSSPPPSPPTCKPASFNPSMYGASAPRPRRGSPPQTLLGAIDENSGVVQPDVPLSPDQDAHPVARLHVYTSATNSRRKTTLASASAPPANEFDSLLGPHGESFADLRMNKKMATPSREKGWKKLVCFG